MLYDRQPTDTGGVELILKDLVCGGDTRNFYVAGVDFDVNLLSMSSFNKPGFRLEWRILWNYADDVVKMSRRLCPSFPN